MAKNQNAKTFFNLEGVTIALAVVVKRSVVQVVAVVVAKIRRSVIIIDLYCYLPRMQMLGKNRDHPLFMAI